MNLDAVRAAVCRHDPQVCPRRSIDSAARSATTAPSVRATGCVREADTTATVLFATRPTADGGTPALINARFTMLSVAPGQV